MCSNHLRLSRRSRDKHTEPNETPVELQTVWLLQLFWATVLVLDSFSILYSNRSKFPPKGLHFHQLRMRRRKTLEMPKCPFDLPFFHVENRVGTGLFADTGVLAIVDELLLQVDTYKPVNLLVLPAPAREGRRVCIGKTIARNTTLYFLLRPRAMLRNRKST